MQAPTTPVTRTRPASLAALTRHCIAYGVPFQLYAANQPTLASMLDVLPFGTEIVDSGSADSVSFQLPAQDELRFPTLLQRLQQQIVLHVGVHAPERVFLHSGAVTWQGRAILLPGFSHAGKTTLVAELVRLGALYYSDDYALLDASGRVHPYPGDLQVRGSDGLQSRKIAVSDLPGKAGVNPAPVAQIVITNFAAGASWDPEALSPGMAVLEMLRHSIAAQRQPARVLETLKAVMRDAQAFRSPRGDARATAELLLNAFDRRGQPA